MAWARPGSGFTLLFEALLMALVSEMPVRAVADLVGEHDTRLWRILHHFSRLEPMKDFAYTVGEHWDGILRWHNTRISNGVLEGINSLVQAAKRRAPGTAQHAT